MKSYLLHLKQSFIDVFGKASKINLQYCPRSSKLPEEYVQASPSKKVGQHKHNHFPSLPFAVSDKVKQKKESSSS